MITFPILDTAGNPSKKAKAKKVAFGSTIFEDEKEKKVSKKSYNSTLPVSFLCSKAFYARSMFFISINKKEN